MTAMTAAEFKAARLSRGLTQDAFALLLGTYQPRICDYERGRLPVPRPIVAHVATLLSGNEEQTQGETECTPTPTPTATP